MTRELRRQFDNPLIPNALDKLDADPAVRQHVMDRFNRDEERYVRTGDPMRHDVQNARKIYAQQASGGFSAPSTPGRSLCRGWLGLVSWAWASRGAEIRTRAPVVTDEAA
jgi:hypothetical protein